MITDSSLYEGCPQGMNWGTGCIIIKNNQVLLGLRTDNKLWGTPGGGVEIGETPVAGIIREIKEETGLDVNVFFLEYVGQIYSLNENVIWHSFCFVCSNFSGELKPQTGEVEELRWVPLNDLHQYSLFTPSREALMFTLQTKPELIYPDFYDIKKLTSLEQLVDVKNPGKNGGNGMIGADGNWKYKKPGHQGENRAALPKENDSQPIGQVKQLKQSYMQHFQNMSDFKVVYKVQDGQFVFPEYNNAIADGLVKDKKAYRLLFNEQFMHFAMSNKK